LILTVNVVIEMARGRCGRLPAPEVAHAQSGMAALATGVAEGGKGTVNFRIR